MKSAPAPSPARRSGTVTGALLVATLKLVWTAFVIATPVLGAWVASSLAAYSNGPVWLAAASGLLFFPVGPLAWELFGTWRRARRADAKRRVLTFADRLVLRTLALNLVFLGGLVGLYPQRGFVALATRGDWMLDGRHDAGAERVRAAVFRAAGALEWLYVAARPNPYRRHDTDAHAEHPHPTPEPTHVTHDTGTGTQPAPAAVDPHRWPFAATLHPLVTQIPASAEGSIASVAQWIAEREPDPWQRIKALHDWVADRVAYDAAAYAAHAIPYEDGDAEHTFRTHVGVCAGYAKLLQALGRAAGMQVEYVVGDGRNGGGLNGESHAWNAVKLDGHWYLIDATWDAGSVEGTVFTKRYTSDFFLTPADVFTLSHFPDDAEWQLLDRPVSRGDFFRAPMLRPAFYAQGFVLRAPTRSQVTVTGDAFDVELGDPRGLWVLAAVYSPSGSEATRCEVTDPAAVVRVSCRLPGPGTWSVKLFASPARYNSAYASVGQLDVNRAR